MSFELPVEPEQRNPLIVVLALPLKRAVETKRNSFGRQVVVQAEVALVKSLASGSQS